MFYATGLPGWLRGGGSLSSPQGSDPGVEKQALKRQAEALQSELDSVNKRLGEVDSKTSAG
jgi:hypothetical protein